MRQPANLKRSKLRVHVIVPAHPRTVGQGREGIWTALASAPLFAAKLPTGVVSGQLLQTLCPAPGACPAELGAVDGAAAAPAATAATGAGGRSPQQHT